MHAQGRRRTPTARLRALRCIGGRRRGRGGRRRGIGRRSGFRRRGGLHFGVRRLGRFGLVGRQLGRTLDGQALAPAIHALPHGVARNVGAHRAYRHLDGLARRRRFGRQQALEGNRAPARERGQVWRRERRRGRRRGRRRRLGMIEAPNRRAGHHVHLRFRRGRLAGAGHLAREHVTLVRPRKELVLKQRVDEVFDTLGGHQTARVLPLVRHIGALMDGALRLVKRQLVACPGRAEAKRGAVAHRGDGRCEPTIVHRWGCKRRRRRRHRRRRRCWLRRAIDRRHHVGRHGIWLGTRQRLQRAVQHLVHVRRKIRAAIARRRRRRSDHRRRQARGPGRLSVRLGDYRGRVGVGRRLLGILNIGQRHARHRRRLGVGARKCRRRRCAPLERLVEQGIDGGRLRGMCHVVHCP